MKSFLNIFFIINTVLSSIKILSTKSLSSSLTPLITVIAIGLVLDSIEEIKRYRNDLKTNNTKTKVYKNEKLRNTVWSKIKIGNLLKVKKDENIPADLLVIFSSNKEGNLYLQTSNIDGETNLKERDSLNHTQKIFFDKNFKKNYHNLKTLFSHENNNTDTEAPNCIIEVEQPNKNIYEANGSIIFSGNNKIYFDIKNVAIRGAKLKNTEFIYGIVIYTGKDTKIMKNITKHKVKSATIDKWVDNIVIIILIIRFIYIIVFMLIGMMMRYKYLPSYDDSDKNKVIYDYIFYYKHYNGSKDQQNFLESVKYFTAHFICSEKLLPTSVVLLSAISKVIQSLFLEFLEKPLRQKENEKMKCLTTELLSDLGSVKYIFSDKTGTLTKNETQFKACSIFTHLFDENDNYDENMNFISKSNAYSMSKSNNNLNYSKMLSTASKSNFSNNFDVNNILKRLKLRNIPIDIKNIKGCPFQNQGEALEEFMLNMALNHDILVESKVDNETKNIKKKKKIYINEDINYEGTNPDEITLVGVAKELGFCFMGKIGNEIKIRKRIYNINDINGINEINNNINSNTNNTYEIRKFQLLLKIPFISARQRSSVVVKDLSLNKIKIYNKGSDIKIFEKINEYSKKNILEITKDHVNNFARRGLRTLCYSYKVIPQEEWDKWFNEYNILREAKKTNNSLEQKFEALYDTLEKDCFLLGATALEDQLQNGVKDDIQQFIEAGINFWMITGDKMDTAESIGHSIKLFDSDTEVFKIKGNNLNEIIRRMKEIKEDITKAQAELSNFNIDDEKGKKISVDKKVDLLKKKVKSKIETIYEDANELKDYDKYENDIISRNKKLQKHKNENEEIKININNSQDNKKKNIITFKTFNRIENGNDLFYENKPFSEERLINKDKDEDVNEENNKNDYFTINDIINENQEINSNKKKDSIPNMSIFKFMVDNQYFINSNVELENFSIIKNNVEKKSFSMSDKSDISNGGCASNDSSKKNLNINTQDIGNIKNEKKNEEKILIVTETNMGTIKNTEKNITKENINNKDIKLCIKNDIKSNSDIDQDNLSFTRSIIMKNGLDENKKDNKDNKDDKNIKSEKTKEKKKDEVLYKNSSINSKKENNNELKINTDSNISKSNKLINRRYNNIINNIDIEVSKKVKENINIFDNKNFMNSDKNIMELRKIQRSKINLPTKASSFLEFFDECLEKAKEAFNIEQKALTLFKVPYLYNVINKEDDYLSEEKGKNWTKRLKVKNYLLHTKIKYSLILNGDCVGLCTEKGDSAELFWFLIQHSRSVICCRCSPTQKSSLVKFVRENTKDLTLAIGDGENDVDMIKTANIGIGIYGKEGSQAAFNADYAFYEFKYLKRLLFANGRFILLRNSYLYNLFFSKNFVYTLQYLLFNFFTLYSGSFFFDEFYDSMWNTFVSIIPLVTYSILEEDIDIDFNSYGKKEKVWMSYLLPDMYKQARDMKPINVVKYLVVTFLSLIMAMIYLGLFNLVFLGTIKNNRGNVPTFYDLIFYIYISILCTHLFMIYIDTSLYNYIIFIIFFIQVIMDILFFIIMNNIDNDFQLSNKLGEILNSNICFLACVAICSTICLSFFILRRAELFFGINLPNLIKINKLEAIYKGKYYKKKINQMIRAIRGIVKFKKIHKEMKDEKSKDNKSINEYDNLVDINIKKMVQHYDEINRHKKNK